MRRPVFDLPRAPTPAAELADESAEVRAQPRRPGEPIETQRPSLPSFRLPEPRPSGTGGVGNLFRPPGSFNANINKDKKPADPDTSRPPPEPSPEDEDVEEIDEIDPIDELDEDVAPPVAAAPRPPPPRAPPPLRPPSLSPDKKK